MQIIDFLQVNIAGNTLQTWLIATAIATIVFVLAEVVRGLMMRQLKARLMVVFTTPVKSALPPNVCSSMKTFTTNLLKNSKPVHEN